jgi:ABC-type bacteriocin/lantibiotic exporter with double-glycine peptidase domain
MGVSMRLVHQQDDDTCGVACVAMICGLSFKQAKAFMWEAGDGYTQVRRLIRALRHFGATVHSEQLKRSDFRKYSMLPFDAVINFSQAPGEPFWNSHWAVWDVNKGKLLDPDKDASPNGADHRYGFRYLHVGRLCRPVAEVRRRAE